MIRRGNSSLAYEMLGCTCSLVQNALKVSSLFQNRVCRSQADLNMSSCRCSLEFTPQCLAFAGAGVLGILFRGVTMLALSGRLLGCRSPLRTDCSLVKVKPLKRRDPVSLTKMSSNSLKVCIVESC